MELFETDRCHEVYKKINGVVKDETILTIRLMSLGGKSNPISEVIKISSNGNFTEL